MMNAFTKTKYGGPKVLRLEKVEKPSVKSGHLLVKVMANSANPADWHIIRGTPVFARLSFGLWRPKDKIPGADFAGIVEEVGEGVTNFNPGDRVFGQSMNGAFAQFNGVPANVCALMPENAGFPEMACVPIAGLTALQALTTHGNLKKGESVLVNGSSGGVGHFTVQIAKAYGAHVVGVCSAKNVDFVKSLGADKVIAYDQVNIHQHGTKYDLMIDTHGNLFHKDYKRMGRRGVMVGFVSVGHLFNLFLQRALSKYPLAQFIAVANTSDLEILASLVEEEKIKAHIDKTYDYTDIPEAIRYIETMHTRGKVAMVWEK